MADLGRQRFEAIDKNGDSGISLTEFKENVEKVPLYRILAALFRAHDLDRDGKITLKEFDPDAAENVKREL